MKIVFLGWGNNGEKCLSTILKNKFEVVHVFAPKGYESQRMYEVAKHSKIPSMYVRKNMSDIYRKISAEKPDLMVIASFPWLLKEKMINLLPLGCINVHASALPKYRGYHPLNWAIIKDEKKIGVTVHYVDRDIDSGDILAQQTIPITNIDDVITLRNKLTSIGALLLNRVLKKIRKANRKITGHRQNTTKASFAPRRKPADGKIKWTNNAREIFNLIRALKSPYPNAFAYNEKGERVEMEKSYVGRTHGQVLAKVRGQYLVSVADGVILLKSKKKLFIGEVLR